MTAAAVVVAAGRGERLGARGPKAFVTLAGIPLLVHAVRALEAAALVGRIIVVVGTDDVARARSLLSAAGCGKVGAVVPGGADRQGSVFSGLAEVGSAPLVAVHDGARPLVRPALVDRVIAAAQETGAASAGIPIRQTVKLVEGGQAVETVDRDRLWIAHTPQAFATHLLRRAHEQALQEGWHASDDAGMVERCGQPVRMVEDSVLNLKVTVPDDLALAEAMLATAHRPAAVRTGIGFDVHRLAAGRRLVLGGVVIDSERGLLGHSDADVVAHAVMDALLGAAGLGDIGRRFPPTDAAYEGADSIALLREVASAVGAEGWEIAHVDVTVLAEAPMIGPYLPQMTQALAGALGIPSRAVNLKATTMEGLGAIGRHEGIAAQAVATLIGNRGQGTGNR
ncbi:MAG TPA: 2-C-methyl-D-erythritol 4-phosphate cytidylyltransferase [bacterium]|jgi:2-C-methyl-D-erythritol 4-phosphate cytidylyltransferase/2-C-methyl-D-erythritol 2,4-cyclodiphosphate synthase